MLLTNATAGALWVPLLVLAAIAAVSFKMAGGNRSGLNRWAKANGFRLLAADRRFLDRGPFPERIPRGLGVFHVTVEDETGRQRNGYVRCSIGLLGLFLDEAAVRWDD